SGARRFQRVPRIADQRPSPCPQRSVDGGAVRPVPGQDSEAPDISGPGRYLGWMVARHGRVLTLDSVCNALWAGAQGLTPAAIGAAVQAGLVARKQTALIWWGLAVLFRGVAQPVFAMFVERLEMKTRVESGYQTLRFVTRQVCDLGAAVGQRVSAGDLVTVGVSD